MRIVPFAIALSLGTLPVLAGDPAVVSAGKDGFSIRSADGDYVLKIRGYVQFDGSFFVDDAAKTETDTFQIRRARPILEGTAAKIFDFKIMPDFGQGKTVLYDAYVDIRFHPLAKLRAGKFKPPVGLERLQSAVDTLFVTRAAPTLLVPNRDVGLQLHGDYREGLVAYAVMLGNGTPDAGISDLDASDEKETAARIFVQPIQNVEFGFGLAGSYGKSRGTSSATGLGPFKSPGDLTFFAYRSDGTAGGTVVADGSHTRLAPQAYGYAGRVSVLAEYVASSQVVRLGSATATVDNTAAQLAVGVFLTRDRGTYKTVSPAKPFLVGGPGKGAVQLAARWSRVDVDADAFPVFADPAKSARRAVESAVGVNWYLTRNLRITLDFDRTAFAGGGAAGADRETENVVLSRIQVAF